MAKAKPAKPKKEPKLTKEEEGIDPKKVHELLGIPGPYEAAKEPPGWPDWINWWDCGMSINTLHLRRHELFYPAYWYSAHAFAKASDAWKWRQIRFLPPGTSLEKQLSMLRKGDEVATAREVVAFVATHFLLTSERKEVRVRTKDKLPDLRRIVVSFTKFGFDLGSCSDEYDSPTLGLAVSFTPPVKK
jgi:hypothetical protein